MTDAERKALIAENIARLFQSLDDRDWNSIRALCSDEINVNYPSKKGGPEVISSDELIAGLKTFLPGFDSTCHHVAVPVTKVDDRNATSQVDVCVTHFIKDAADGGVWRIGVRYVIGTKLAADTWKICSTGSRVLYEEGNLGLEALARQNVLTRGHPS